MPHVYAGSSGAIAGEPAGPDSTLLRTATAGFMVVSWVSIGAGLTGAFPHNKGVIFDDVAAEHVSKLQPADWFWAAMGPMRTYGSAVHTTTQQHQRGATCWQLALLAGNVIALTHTHVLTTFGCIRLAEPSLGDLDGSAKGVIQCHHECEPLGMGTSCLLFPAGSPDACIHRRHG